MEPRDCERLMADAESKAKGGFNRDAMSRFIRAAECWERWESFTKAALAFERAYEHAMLCYEYGRATQFLLRASYLWGRQGEFDKSELVCQIAADACILAAERRRDPFWLVEGAFFAILGGDLEASGQLIDAARITCRGRNQRLVDIAALLKEYELGAADAAIAELASGDTHDNIIERVIEYFNLVFAGFVRSSLESEAAVTVANLAASTGLSKRKTRRIVRNSIRLGLIPAYFDEENDELIVDSDRYDIDSLVRRKGPIMSRDLEDPGAWDLGDDDE